MRKLRQNFGLDSLHVDSFSNEDLPRIRKLFLESVLDLEKIIAPSASRRRMRYLLIYLISRILVEQDIYSGQDLGPCSDIRFPIPCLFLVLTTRIFPAHRQIMSVVCGANLRTRRHFCTFQGRIQKLPASQALLIGKVLFYGCKQFQVVVPRRKDQAPWKGIRTWDESETLKDRLLTSHRCSSA